MNAVEQFNKILNQDKQNRFELWGNYRKNLTSYIIQNLPKTERNLNGFIFATGNSDDLDLEILTKTIKHITLSDIDKTSLEKAITKYNLDSSEVGVFIMDYIGLNIDNNWNDFVKILLQVDDKKNIDYFFKKLESSILNYRFPETIQSYDIVIISPIYTQLLLQQGLSYISILKDLNYSFDLLKYITEKLMDLMPMVIETFNNNVVSCLNKNATLIAISDIFEARLDSDFYQSLSKGIHEPNQTEQIYEEYRNTYGIGLGDYGLIHLDHCLKQTQFKWFEWPFNTEKSLFVKVAIYKN